MKKNSKKITAVTMTGAVLLAAPIAMNAAPMMSAQTVNAAVKTGWAKESGKWYFYKDGVKATGWQEWDGKRYYLNSDGTMKANEWMIDTDGSIYYFRSWGGIYKNGFQNIGGNEYYFRSWGGVYRNTFFTVKGKTYIAQNDGSIYHASQTGWVQLGDQTYWINQDGSVQAG